MLTLVSFSLYAINLAVGMSAQIWRHGFGAWHHILYALVFAAAIAATAMEFHPSLLVTVAALAALPWTRPRTFWHPALAVVGAFGYLPALLL